MASDYGDYPFFQYRSVGELRAMGMRRRKELERQGYELCPIEPFSGNRIAKSFWGHGWCRHLESFSDYSNRLPRGRSYARNGMVCHLRVESGRIEALVSGSELYEIDIRIEPLPKEKWEKIKRRCGGKIGSLLELLQGRLSDEVMSIVTDQREGLFPSPDEIRLNCNCADWADLCKHLAAVLYGVGARLDDQPELIFLLRGVDQNELIAEGMGAAFDAPPAEARSKRRRLASEDVSGVFGIELDRAVPSAGVEEAPDALSQPEARREKKASRPPRKRSSSVRRKKPVSPRTGADVRKLRRKFGMSEWEFGFMIDVSPTTVRNWESKGRQPHRAREENQRELDAVARLSVEQAWERLNEYL